DADRAHQARACGQGQEGVPETDQATSRNQVFEANAALLVVADLNHLAAAHAQRLGDRADELFADVNGEVLDRLHALAVDELDDRLGPGDLELITLATHGLDEDRKVQLAAAAEKDPLGDVGVGDMQAQVGVELLVETGAKLAGGRELALAARKRRRVDPEGHAHGGLFDLDPGQGVGGLRIRERVADRHLLEPGQEHYVARARARHRNAIQAPIDEHLRDFDPPLVAVATQHGYR